MNSLKAGGALYIYSSEDVDCIVSGYTVILGVRKDKVLFQYIVRAGTTRLVYISQEITVVTDITVYSRDVDTINNVYVDGTDVDDQLYESVAYTGYKVLMEGGRWVNNVFDPPADSGGGVDTGNDYFP